MMFINYVLRTEPESLFKFDAEKKMANYLETESCFSMYRKHTKDTQMKGAKDLL